MVMQVKGDTSIKEVDEKEFVSPKGANIGKE